MSRLSPPPPTGPLLPTPTLNYFGTLRVRIGPLIVVGETPEGIRRIIPILGGDLEGPGVRGRILASGADFQLVKSPTLTELEAKYAIELENGELLWIDNRGIHSGAREDIAALARGAPVPLERIYFRTSMRASGPGVVGRMLAERFIIGTGRRIPEGVGIDLYIVG